MGFLAAMAALMLGGLSTEELDFEKVKLLCASSVITAFLAAFALGELCPHPSTSTPPGLLACPTPQGSSLRSLCFQIRKMEH